MALARGDTHVIAWAGAVIAAFVRGAFLGLLVAALETQVRLPLILAGELVCFLAAWTLLGRRIAEAALLLVAL
jgi:oxalate decarboxylase